MGCDERKTESLARSHCRYNAFAFAPFFKRKEREGGSAYKKSSKFLVLFVVAAAVWWQHTEREVINIARLVASGRREMGQKG